MRQNLFSAMIQTGASLGIAFLSVAIFRFLTPDQVAFLRQHYFVPFALVTSFSPANQNYLRSILFSSQPPAGFFKHMNSLAIVQLVSGGLLLAIILISIDTSGTGVGWLNVLALAVALLLVLARTIVTGVLEFRGKYTVSIVLNNTSSAIPYLAAFSLIFISEMSGFFVGSIALSLLNIIVVLMFAAKLSKRTLLQFVNWTSAGFDFHFRRYLSLSLIALGSVVVYQGVEFCLYNYTEYNHVEIANYSLAFSISAIMRQIILSAVQPLEREQDRNASVGVPGLFEIRRPVAVELIIYLILIGAVVTLPTILAIAFPNFNTAASFVPPLLLGVLGSAIQQVYSVRMIASARTGFLGGTQIALALSCVLAVLLLNASMSLLHVIWLISVLIWIRGCFVIPVYVDLQNSKYSSGMWITRIALSAILFLYFFKTPI